MNKELQLVSPPGRGRGGSLNNIQNVEVSDTTKA